MLRNVYVLTHLPSLLSLYILNVCALNHLTLFIQYLPIIPPPVFTAVTVAIGQEEVQEVTDKEGKHFIRYLP
jgi:hypothetical protein